MPVSVLYSAIIITAALLFYSIGVWSERYSGILKTWHLYFFWLGLLCDTVGTGMMMDNFGNIVFNLHTLTGFSGIFLMVIHTVWATIVIAKNDIVRKEHFHRFSLFVWSFWLISYASGVFIGIRNAG
ncbi:MAG: TIGR03987 family protein [FCB group bacterium]|nr:TIGR03987 family protein [FCB group bacterium]